MKKILLFIMLVVISFLSSCSLDDLNGKNEKTEEKTAEKTKENTEEKTPEEKTEEYQNEEQEALMAKLRLAMPEGNYFEDITSTLIVYESSGVNAVYEETKGKGFVIDVTVETIFSPINVLVGIDQYGKIVGINVNVEGAGFPVSDETIDSFIGKDSNLQDIFITLGATSSSNAVKQAVDNAFNVLTINELIKPAVKSIEQIYEELLPTVYPNFVMGEELEGTENIKKAFASKNHNGIVCYYKNRKDALLITINISAHTTIYKAQLIDDTTQTYELIDVTNDYLSLVYDDLGDIFDEYYYYIYGDCVENLENYILKEYRYAELIRHEYFTNYGTITAFATFEIEEDKYYAYCAQPVNGFQGDVMDIFVVLDSEGKIVKVDVNTYFYGYVEYFLVAQGFDENSYESNLNGLTSETYHGYETMISGATYTSKAIEAALRDVLAEFNR